jgi:hypothetical protein
MDGYGEESDRETDGRTDGEIKKSQRQEEKTIDLFIQILVINPLTPELNPSAQRCLTRFLLGILLLEPYISLTYA